MTRNTPNRILLSLAVSSALIGCVAMPVYAQTVNYKGSQAKYDELVPDLIAMLGPAPLRLLAHAGSPSNNMVNVTDTDDMSATEVYNKPDAGYRGLAGAAELDVDVTGNAVTIGGCLMGDAGYSDLGATLGCNYRF